MKEKVKVYIKGNKRVIRLPTMKGIKKDIRE